jgi:hypothetical protein
LKNSQITRPQRRRADLKVAMFITVVVIVIVVTVLVSLNLGSFIKEGDGLGVSPVQEGDYIVFSVNGTENGINITGTSIWTFSNVSGHPNVDGMEGWNKYDISVRTVLDGKMGTFETAGAYTESKVWGLGINPAAIVDGVLVGSSGYYNGGVPTNSTNETISTLLGEKESGVYVEQYQYGSSHMWIDGTSGLPLKMQWTGSVGVEENNNPIQVLLIFEILGTNIGSR